MPPSRPRPVADDVRSEASSTVGNHRDKPTSSQGVSKSKKNTTNYSHTVNSTVKTATVNGALAAAASTNPAANRESDFPHADWLTLPVDILHRYRSVYRLNTPSAYTQPHADLLYNSSPLALRAPSQVLARRKLRDLKAHRQKLADQTSNTHTNGVSKSRPARLKDGASNKSSCEHSRDGRRKQPLVNEEKDKDKEIDPTEDNTTLLPTANGSAEDSSSAVIVQSIEQDASSSTTTTTAEQSGATSASNQADTDMTSRPDTDPYTIPPTLNQQDPESTIIGSQDPHSLASTIRKHFNAQHLNEPDTISRFTYVVRQQGCSTHSRTFSSVQKPAATGNSSANLLNADASTLVTSATASSSKAAHNSLLTGPTSHLGGGQVHVEGSLGDGNGWVMGSMGREIKLGDAGGGGGGTFRLRFRP